MAKKDMRSHEGVWERGLPRYEVYKDSTESWISEIPNHWEVKKLKHIFYEKRYKKNPELNCGSISFGKVVRKNDENIPFSTKASYQEVSKGEFLINPLNLNYDLKSLRIALSEINVVVSSGYIVLKEKTCINRQYYKYLLHRYDVAYMKLLGSGVRQTINFNHIANSILLFPPLLEQTTIANFLDQKTSQIDQAIAIKEKQISPLKERKQILIQNAVTRGLNPNVPLRDSGVEWIGEIPEHWEVKRIKHLGKIINGYAFSSEIFTDYGVKVMKIANIQTMKLDWSEKSFVDVKQYVKHKQFRIFRGDLVFALTRPIISTGIKAAIVDSNDKLLLNQRNAVLKPNKLVIKNWLYFLILNQSFIGQFELQIDNTGQQPNISTVAISNLQVPIPPKHEQRKISAYIEQEILTINKAITLQNQQIEKLKEYKTTLINSAVTGKIRIPLESAS